MNEPILANIPGKAPPERPAPGPVPATGPGASPKSAADFASVVAVAPAESAASLAPAFAAPANRRSWLVPSDAAGVPPPAEGDAEAVAADNPPADGVADAVALVVVAQPNPDGELPLAFPPEDAAAPPPAAKSPAPEAGIGTPTLPARLQQIDVPAVPQAEVEADGTTGSSSDGAASVEDPPPLDWKRPQVAQQVAASTSADTGPRALAAAGGELAPDTGILRSDTFPGLERREVLAGAAPGPGSAAPGLPTHATAHAITIQITRAMPPAGVDPGRPDELTVRLDPPELGAVRISLSLTENAVTAIVQADRSDIDTLLRRHADMLFQALKEAGYRDINIGFGTHGDQRPQPQIRIATFHGDAEGGLPGQKDSTEAVSADRRQILDRHLDIRL